MFGALHFVTPVLRGGLFAVSGRRRVVRACALGLLAVLTAFGVAAQDKPDITFLGQSVTPLARTYVVTKDLNVRGEPDTNGKKVGSYREGDRLKVVGKAKGSWLAVRADGKDLGFVYGPVLMPLIDAVVNEPLTGTAPIAGGSCAYRAVFEGESPIEGQMFNSVDYRAMLECRRDGKSFAFEMPLFITEGPYNGGVKSIHQIGLDVLELSQEYERVFSTNLLYDADKGEVRLDTVSVDKYLAAGKTPSIPAEDVSSALAAAIALAVKSWSPAFWTDFAKALRGSGG
tara:strand:- start:1053 stop:1910 length:858 start_codon:yes stop_codon:yes gene_type:complete